MVSTEFQLPERSLVKTSLQFQAPELQFYSAVRDKMRAVRDEIAELSSPGGSQRQQAGAGAGPRKRRRTLGSLEDQLVQESVELRLACIHPQLTKHWQELGAELDLAAGGTVSMEEVMQRLVDKATFELQDAERSLCGHLNSLAILLLRSTADLGGGEGTLSSLGGVLPKSSTSRLMWTTAFCPRRIERQEAQGRQGAPAPGRGAARGLRAPRDQL